MIGYTLGGRYELQARIGGGGMALVYKARDNLLNRFVAVKVLRQQFMHDDDFVRRFRREAQAAASLSHPNIVSIYDVGQEDDTYYIVMEYVDGNNLNEIIRDRAPLQVEEAVRIAAQICDALDHAHHNQIIHRDIKPHNILIGRNGRVKVTDFGIARAVTASTITQTGSVVGSVHYFSPEHAKGVATGEKSDIYSLGIVLYQMLTGRLPFLGESPISVALKHLQEPFEDPRLVNPHIPQSVENIILKAMRKRPEERYASAKEMLGDLETCLQPQRLHEPRASFAGDEDEDEQTRVIPALRPDMQLSGEETVAKGDSRHRQPEEEVYEEEEEPRRRWVLPTVLTVVAVVLIGILVWAVMELRGSLTPKDVQVPTVIGEKYADAKALLEQRGLQVLDPPPQKPSDAAEGEVIDQDRRDMSVKEGATITLTVSSGPELSKMPSLEDYSYDDAVDQLKTLGVDDSRIHKDEDFSDKDLGTVIGQTPEAKADFDPAKDEVTLTVSKGPDTVTMPDLTGKTLDEAKAELLKANLTLDDKNVHYEASYTTKDLIFKQSPDPSEGKVPVDSTIEVWISSGYPPDAHQPTYKITASPQVPGTESTIRIVISDARGDNVEWKTEKIKSTTTYSVTLILAPGTEGSIKVYRDDVLEDTRVVPYDELSPPDSSPPATDEPPRYTGDPSGPDTPTSGDAANPDDTGAGSGNGNNGDGSQSGDGQ